MKGLLIKDFKLMKTQKSFFVAIFIIAVFATFSTGEFNNTFSVGFLGFVGAMFTLSTISYDEFDNGYPFLFSLPITRKTYTEEKYVFGLICASSAWAIGVILSLGFAMIKGTDIPSVFFIASAVLLMSMVLMLAVMLPFQLKFGGEKGRIALLSAVGIVFAVGFMLTKLAALLNIDIESIFSNLPIPSVGVIAALAIIITLILMIVSMKISTSIMKKKEF